MKQNVFKIIIICLILILLIFMPYLPGNFDNMVIMISVTIQMTSFVSLLFVPLGLIWLVCELRFNNNLLKKRKIFKKTFMFISFLCFLIASFTTLGGISFFRGSIVFTIIIFILFLYLCVYKINLYFKKIDTNRCYFYLYLLVIPIIVVSVRIMFIEQIANYSRNIVINNSQIIIDNLEDYYRQNKVYPDTLQGVWKDYYPGVMGVEKYYYKLNNESYDLYFEYFNPDLTVLEIVMYNNQDEHIIRSHPSFVFLLSADEFERYRGYFRVSDLPQKYWKTFLFD